MDTSTQRDDNDHVDRVSIGNVNISAPAATVGASTVVPSVTVALAKLTPVMIKFSSRLYCSSWSTHSSNAAIRSHFDFGRTICIIYKRMRREKYFCHQIFVNDILLYCIESTLRCSRVLTRRLRLCHSHTAHRTTLARPLFSLEIACWTSSAVMGFVSGDGTPVKAGNS